ncbi:OmpA family protein [Thiocystis violacea]|uniref:OmpA family protein n=1 Tax=Thiocystis violacea TaxID=13725 RepID=UPI001F5B96EE|nr:OmpA family protein [Thiocystis violacea]MBK1716234.1 hypothetical protein [Thiocystis violacea]
MSETNPNPAPTPTPTPKSPSLLGAGYLLSMFAAGLVLVYALDHGRGPNVLDGSEAPLSPARVTDSAMTAEDADGSIGQLRRDTRDLGETLTETQRRVETLEADLMRLRRDQVTMLESERQRIARELDSAARASGPTPAGGSSPEEDPLARLRHDLAGLEARFTETGVLLSLSESDLGFRPGIAALPSGRPESLSRVASVLELHPDLKILLRGHTDSSGKAASNLALSERRALAVRESLIALGVPASRILAEGAGESAPIADNATDQGRRLNRRVEIHLTRP